MKENNPDWIRRQKSCDICGKPIGDEAMIRISNFIYHAKCYSKASEKLDQTTPTWKH